MKIDKEILKNIQNNKYLDLIPELKAKKAEDFLTLVLTFITLSFFGFFAISPTLSTITQLKKQLIDNVMVENQLEEKIKNLSLLQQQYSLLISDLPIVFSAIPQSPNPALFAAQIQSLSQITGTRISAFQTFPVQIEKSNDNNNLVQNTEEYSSYVFSINIEGPNKNVQSFIDSLINFDRIVTISNITLSKNYEISDNVKLSLKGEIYFKK